MRLNKHTRATDYTYIGQKHATALNFLSLLSKKRFVCRFVYSSFSIVIADRKACCNPRVKTEFVLIWREQNNLLISCPQLKGI